MSLNSKVTDYLPRQPKSVIIEDVKEDEDYSEIFGAPQQSELSESSM